ncbi:septation protein SepH [Arsenicicoccus cauae]|uniref:septation protein SepH n=1 Tax=Arsenicicoccus cauae TaxID=2663847 RepID=UPI00370DA4EA
MSVQDLRLVGIADDGVHLLLATDDGARYRVPLDSALRSAVRHERPRPAEGGAAAPSAGPRQVQALIRAGASADEVAELTGWSLERIARYEGPIIAEREHVAGLATSVRLRSPGGQPSPLLASRVADRLTERGVDPTSASWDAWRGADSPWTLALTFAAGGRLREARWHFDLGTRAVEPIDDEARWLTGDDAPSTTGPAPLVPLTATPRVYDVESEGGIHSPQQSDDGGDDLRPITAPEPARTRRQHDDDEDSDLVDSMRERSRARRRRVPARPARAVPTQEPLMAAEVEQAPDQSPAEQVPVEQSPAEQTSVERAPRRGRARRRGARSTAQPETGPAESAPAAPSEAGPTPEATVPLDREEIAAALSAGSVGELDAVVDEVIADREGESSRPSPDEPALPQGGPVNPAALRPDGSSDELAPDAEEPAAEEPETEAPDTAPRPHPRVPGQVALPDLDHGDDESRSLADHTSGTSSRAAEPETPETSEPDQREAAQAASDQAGPDRTEPAQAGGATPPGNRSQRRAQTRRKAGRPSVPSWDDIMFGAKPE